MDTRNLTEEQTEALINCGAFDYDYIKIANILDLDSLYVQEELSNKDSEISKLIKKGKDMYDYTIDSKLLDLVHSGDLAALDKLEKRKWANSYDKKQIK
jgi:hypothetical protein